MSGRSVGPPAGAIWSQNVIFVQHSEGRTSCIHLRSRSGRNCESETPPKGLSEPQTVEETSSSPSCISPLFRLDWDKEQLPTREQKWRNEPTGTPRRSFSATFQSAEKKKTSLKIAKGKRRLRFCGLLRNRSPAEGET